MAERDDYWLPWCELLRFAVFTLKLSPEIFWHLSLNELRALLNAGNQAARAAPNRHDLQSLMAHFPDE